MITVPLLVRIRQFRLVNALPVSVFVVLGSALQTSAHAATSHITLLSDTDNNANRGFAITLENTSDGSAPLPLSAMKLVLKIGDGKRWSYFSASPAWTTGATYTVRATITATQASLDLNGQPACGGSVALIPVAGSAQLVANTALAWQNDPTDYAVTEDGFSISSSGRNLAARSFTLTPNDKRALLFASARDPYRALGLAVGSPPLSIVIKFTLVPRAADPGQFAPLIDKYGQVAFDAWPGKIGSDQQLRASASEDAKRFAAMPPDAQVDPYGGLRTAGWRAPATRYYYIARRNGYDWLITPSGLPCFYTSLCNVPLASGNGTPITGRESLFAELPPQTPEFAPAYGMDMFGDSGSVRYAVFDTVNIILKYGADWRARVDTVARQRLKSWGFSGQGKWSSHLDGVPFVAVLYRAGVPAPHGKPDVFDPAVRAKLRDTLAAQITPERDDAYLVGWSLGNEYDEIVTHSVVTDTLADPQPSPAKKALVDYAVSTLYGGAPDRLASAWSAKGITTDALHAQALTVPASDIEPLRRFYADAYYACVYDTVKSLDSHHLYFGFWIVPNWWENESDWSLIARHCDVIGYDYYADQFADGNLTRLLQQTDKPVFCGEFSYPPAYDGTRGFSLYTSWAMNEADAGKQYRNWIRAAAANPHCIGGSWFEYRDEPVTGRGPGSGPNVTYGENYAFGVVDVTDQPKWPLVISMRAANRAATRIRLNASSAH